MRLTTWLLTAGILLATLLIPSVNAADIVLIENGKSNYVIAIPQQDENRRAGRAAEALQKYLKESTGAELAIVTEDEVPGRAFYLGKTVKGEAAGVPYAELQDYTHCEMVSPAGDVFLAGLDDSCHIQGAMEHHDHEYLGQFRGFHPEVTDMSYKEWRGTHKAVLSFLEDWCGIRFLLPGENGRYIPQVNRLAIPADLHKVTALDLPYSYGRCYGDWDTTIALNQNDLPFYKNYGGHSFPVAVPKKLYGETHPEYYILKDGKRQPYFGPGGANHLCTSNPEVQELMLKEFERQYKRGYRWVQIAPTDGQVECECEECKKMHPVKEERQWILFRKLAEEIAVRWPDAHPVFLAYGYTKNPPTTFDSFPSNTVVELCIWNNIEEQLQKWDKFSDLEKIVYIYIFGSYHSLVFNPVRTPRYIAESLRSFKKHNVKGIFKCGWATCLGLEGPECYMYAKLQEDVTRDEKQLLKEFYTCAYGKGAAQMERFFNFLYSNLDTPAGHSIIEELETRPRNPEFMIQYANRPYQLQQMSHALYMATAAAKDDDPRVKARLALVKREFDFVYNRSMLYRLDEAFSAFPCPDLVNKIEEYLKKRDQILSSWFDKDGKMIHEPGFEWPFMCNEKKDVFYYGGGGTICPYPANFRKGVAPLKLSLKMDTTPADYRFLISDAGNQYQPVEWAKNVHPRALLSFGNPDYPTQVLVAKLKDKLMIFARRLFGKATKPANIEEWQNTALPLDKEQLEVWIDAQGESKRYCHFACNPFGARAQSRRGYIEDPLHPDANKVETNWQEPWECQTEFTKDGWTTVLFIPLSTLKAKFISAQIWRVNFARNGQPWSMLPGNSDLSLPESYGSMDIK